MTIPCNVKFLNTPAFAGLPENKIAYCHSAGKGPGIIWCGGLKSDMEGSKATALHEWARAQGNSFVRFDYFGHGKSTGRFRDGIISRWAADTVQVIDELTQGPQIIVGSSMGGWTALLAALARPAQVKALVLIAPAPDFTEKLMWAGYSDDIRKTIMEEGIYYEPSDYDEPYEISRNLILDGRENLLLDAPINFKGPVHILQGMKDTSVPWQHAQRLIDVLVSDDVEMTLVKGGDHSLSTPQDLERLLGTVQTVSRHVHGNWQTKTLSAL